MRNFAAQMQFFKPFFFLLTAGTAIVSGCSTNCTGSGSTQATADSASYFRHTNDRAVFRVDTKTYCLVVDERQMAEFGGFSKVKVVPQSMNFLRGKTPVAGLRCSDGP